MSIERRAFLQWAVSGSVALAADLPEVPAYRTVSTFQPAQRPGMPGPYAGQVVSVHAEKCIDTQSEKADPQTVRTMIERGMCALTGERDPRDPWARFFVPSDEVGIKVNCSGAPGIMSSPEVVAEIARNLIAAGVKPGRITVYERFPDQLQSAHYERFVPDGVRIAAVETPPGSMLGYDPKTYVDVNFFGEEDTRSNLVRMVSERFTKIVSVPNIKDHGAAGVTGCLKNIAYGNFSNVARSHSNAQTNTYSFIGTLASVEPLRSRTVLQVMDGLRGVWHGGPFAPDRRFRFYPKCIMFGTDPVAIDRLLLDIIDAKRKAENVISVWDRSREHLNAGRHDSDPNANAFIREPGHIAYAGGLGLGVADKSRIRQTRLEV